VLVISSIVEALSDGVFISPAFDKKKWNVIPSGEIGE
jgi:hypothetical protein